MYVLTSVIAIHFVGHVEYADWAIENGCYLFTDAYSTDTILSHLGMLNLDEPRGGDVLVSCLYNRSPRVEHTHWLLPYMHEVGSSPQTAYNCTDDGFHVSRIATKFRMIERDCKPTH